MSKHPHCRLPTQHRIAQVLTDDGTNMVLRSGEGQIDVRLMWQTKAIRLRLDPQTAARLGAELLLAATPPEPRTPRAAEGT